eukprot:2433875-Rhodomonas_salina.2
MEGLFRTIKFSKLYCKDRKYYCTNSADQRLPNLDAFSFCKGSTTTGIMTALSTNPATDLSVCWLLCQKELCPSIKLRKPCPPKISTHLSWRLYKRKLAVKLCGTV